jgi:ribosomal protein S18 acetylase RimI-like enzyme
VKRTQVRTRWAEDFEIRRAGNTDREAIAEFLTALSPRARYLRFFSGAPPTSSAMLRLLAGGGADTDVLVATDGELVVGHAMAGDRTGPDGTRLTEIGVVVADAYRGLGLGSALVRRMADHARRRGVTAVVMEVLAENQQVLTMIADHWQITREDRSGACVTVWAPLPPETRRDSPAPSLPPAGCPPPGAPGRTAQRDAPVTGTCASARTIVVPRAGRAAGDLVVVPLVGGPVVASVGDDVAGHVGGVVHPGRGTVPGGSGGRGRRR